MTGGYAGTACHMGSALTGDTTSFATVEDDTPTSEPRYRAQFIINADTVAGLSNVDGVLIFTANSGVGSQVSLSVVGDGAGGLLLGYNVPDSSAGGGSDVGAFPLPAGENHVEIDVDNGSEPGGTPHFAIWLNNSNEATPTFQTTTFNNGGATAGIETAFMGLAGATPGFLSGFNGTVVGFDQFDSRRSTFIGGF